MSTPSGFASSVFLVTRDGMGSADSALQHKLFGTYLSLISEHGMLPAAICFYTDGVKLASRDRPYWTC